VLWSGLYSGGVASRLPGSLRKSPSAGEGHDSKMTITLPDESALDTLSKSLAQMLNTGA